MMTHFVLTDKGCFDGVYQVKDQVKIEGKTYYRIGKDGLNDIVVNADNIVISWDLAVNATREWFIEDTIDQLIADEELKRGGLIMMTYFVLTDKGCFNGVYQVKDQVKIEGKTYYRIGKDGLLDDIVVNADNIVISWDLAVNATREWFIEDTIDQLIADKELKRGEIKVEYVINTGRSKKEIAKQLFEISGVCSVDLNEHIKLGMYTTIANEVLQEDIIVTYDADISFPEYVEILMMLTKCASATSEMDEISNYNTDDFVQDEELVNELIKLWLSNRNK